MKSTCYNMVKAGYKVHVLSDCVTSYDLRKIDEMLEYYEKNEIRECLYALNFSLSL